MVHNVRIQYERNPEDGIYGQAQINTKIENYENKTSFLCKIGKSRAKGLCSLRQYQQLSSERLIPNNFRLTAT